MSVLHGVPGLNHPNPKPPFWTLRLKVKGLWLTLLLSQTWRNLHGDPYYNVNHNLRTRTVAGYVWQGAAGTNGPSTCCAGWSSDCFGQRLCGEVAKTTPGQPRNVVADHPRL